MHLEESTWLNISTDDVWVYDKLIIARKLGYICGPVGVPVPSPGTYVVRPVMNVMGMGQQAEIVEIQDTTDHLPIGHFWCEMFTGTHLSVDYTRGKQVLCVEGFRSPNKPLYRWDMWVRVDDEIPYPSILNKDFEYVNCEFVNGRLIEVHLRHNPDFKNGGNVLIPVWSGQDRTPPEGMKYIDSPDYLREGFFIK